jgi:DNA-binding Xre family transcriptional regulator
MPITHLTKKNLNRLMIESDLSIQELSAATGVAKANIFRLKNNASCNPTLSTLIPIAKHFNISVSELIGEKHVGEKIIPEDNSLLKEKLMSNFKNYIDNVYL